MTSIDNKAVGDQYLPSYLSISSWYSPSRCHIQIQSPRTPLKVTAALSCINTAFEWCGYVVMFNVLYYVAFGFSNLFWNAKRLQHLLRAYNASTFTSFCLCRLGKIQKLLSSPPAPVTSLCTTRWHPGGTSSYRASYLPTWRLPTEKKGLQSPLIRMFMPPTHHLLLLVSMFL